MNEKLSQAKIQQSSKTNIDIFRIFSGLFKSQEIDMSSFQTFSDANLKEIGVLAYGARHKMLLAIAGECST